MVCYCYREPLKSPIACDTKWEESSLKDSVFWNHTASSNYFQTVHTSFLLLTVRVIAECRIWETGWSVSALFSCSCFFTMQKRQWHNWSMTKHKMRRQRDLNDKVTLKAWGHLCSHAQFSLPSFLLSCSQSADVFVRKEGKTSQDQSLLAMLWKKMGFIRHSFCRREVLELRNCHWSPGSFHYLRSQTGRHHPIKAIFSKFYI